MKAKIIGDKQPNFKLHIFSLSSLAVAQPLLDVVAKNAELLVARQVTYTDLILVLFLLLLVIPLMLVVPGLLARLHSVTLSNIFHLAVIGLLVGLLTLLALKDTINTIGLFLLLVPLVTVGLFIAAYIRLSVLRMFCDCLALAVVLVPALFLFNNNVSRAVANFDFSTVSADVTVNDIPVVMLVLDELSLVSLLDESGEIDSVRYPNFSALAAGSHWFRNARTVSGSTVTAVPAIISGQYKPRALPVTVDYPVNVFTLLGNSHDLFITEQVTALCPASLCSPANELDPQSTPQRMDGFFADLIVVYFHVLLPQELTRNLPSISQSWGDFVNDSDAPTGDGEVEVKRLASSSTRHGEFAGFLASIEPTEKPGLHFYHSLLPHVPWEYLPSGKRYGIGGSEVPGLDLTTETWSNNSSLVELGYQRYLLQVGYTDKLVGDLLTRLIEENLYDESIVIVVADHGVNFLPGESRRGPVRGIELDLMGIPLFIKEPHQTERTVYDQEVSILDILPTVASLLGIENPGVLRGSNLLASPATSDNAPSNPYANYASLQRKLDLFDSGDPSGVYRTGDFPELLGRNRNELALQISRGLGFTIDQQSHLADVDLNDTIIPARLTGKISGAPDNPGQMTIAVILNNNLVSIADTYLEDAELKFSVMLPETELVNGSNDVELYRVNRDVNQVVSLEPMQNSISSSYRYTSSNSFVATSSGSGNTEYQLIEGMVSGYVDRVVLVDGYYEFHGWAANIAESIPAEFLVLEINGELSYLGVPVFDRPDVAEAFGDPAIEQSGYRVKVRPADLQIPAKNVPRE